MAWYDTLGTVLEAGIPAVMGYLTARDQSSTQRELAKIQASQGGGLGLDTIMALITMGQTMGRQPGPSPVPQVPWRSPIYGYQGAPPALTPGPPLLGPGAQQAPTPLTPGGGPTVTQAPYIQTGFSDLLPLAPGVGGWLMDQLPRGGTSVGELMNLPQVYEPTQSGWRAKSRIITVNPNTGRLNYYKNMGRPVLYSGDLAACKRVRRIASKARRAQGPRRTTTKRRR